MEDSRRASTLAARRRGVGGEVDEGQRLEVVKNRLAALENDGENEPEPSDDEFLVPKSFAVEDELMEVGEKAASQKRKKKAKKSSKLLVVGGKRRTRGMDARAPKGFMQLLDESRLQFAPPHVPTYFSAAAGPSRYPARKLCDISGLPAKYKDPATKVRYHSRREYKIIQAMPTAALHAQHRLM